MKDLKVVEIFESIQGEGARAGELSIFIRLADCNLNCWFCDTDWSKGTMMSIEDIRAITDSMTARWIVWTGGEPTLQLTDEIVKDFYFKGKGYDQAIETNGTNPVSKWIDYITCSPKVEVSIQTLFDNFPEGVDEFRYPVEVGSHLPDIDELPTSVHHFVSPIFIGDKKKRMQINKFNVHACLQAIKKDPRWKLSLQMHKIIDVR